MCGRKATQSQLFCRLRNFWAPLWLRGYHPTPKAFAIPNAEGVRCPPTPKVFAVPQRRRRSLSPNAEGVRCPPTPKAFANASPGLERERQPWVDRNENGEQP